MNLVKWIDADGGWRTGVKIESPDGFSVSWVNGRGQTCFLVRESCTLDLTWVPFSLLSRWASREEWERSAA